MGNTVLGTVSGLGLPYYQVKYSWYRWENRRDLRRTQFASMAK
jgi:hypothetical protein